MQHAYDAAFMEYTPSARRVTPAQAIVRVLREMLSAKRARRGLRTWHLVECPARGRRVEDVFGVDGEYLDPATLTIAPERFRAADLSRPLDLGRQFDLVQS